MSDISVEAGKTILKIGNQEVLLGGVTIEDFGTLQGEILKQRRKKKFETVAAMRDFLPPDEFQQQWEVVRKEAEALECSPEDVSEFISTNEGFATMIWLSTEREYPGRFSRAQILQTIISGEMTEEKAISLMQALEALQQKGKPSGPGRAKKAKPSSAPTT